jgi:Serine/threonine protein kinase
VEIFERVLEASPDVRDQLTRDETENDPEIAAIVRGMLMGDASAADLLDDGIGALAHLAVEPGHVESTELSPGDRIGDFEIIAELGRGGMGIVYAARDRTLGRVAALKLLPASDAIDSAASERLIAEAQAASALDHPNVATIYQIGETHDGHRFIAMARYEGETLRDRLARGPLAAREAFDITRSVVSGSRPCTRPDSFTETSSRKTFSSRGRASSNFSISVSRRWLALRAKHPLAGQFST